MNYTLIRSNRKTIHMKLTADGEIIVRAPRRCPVGYIEEFVQSHRDWIERNRSVILRRKAERECFRLSSGDEISVCGTSFRILIDSVCCPKLSGDCLVLPSGDIDMVRADLLSLISEYSLPRLRKRLDFWSVCMGVSYKSVKISNARRRWGSCSRDGVIRISVYLLLAPMDAIDYVLVHELAHRRVFDHSDSFWMLVASMIPDWKKRKKQLRVYQTEPLIQSLAVKKG